MIKFIRLAVLLSMSLLAAPMTQADGPSEQTVESNTSEVITYSSPRQTVTLMLESMAGKSSIPLSTYFDTRQKALVKRIDVSEVIENFPILLDRHGSLQPVGTLSNDQESSVSPYQAGKFVKIGAIKVTQEQFPILLEYVELNSGQRQWLVSQQTIIDLSKVIEYAQPSAINDLLPSMLLENTFRGAPLGHWLSIVFIAALSIGLGWLISLCANFLAGRIERNHPNSKRHGAVKALALPIGIVFGVFAFVSINRFLGISILIRQDFSIITISFFWLAVFIFLWSLMDSISSRSESLLRERNHVGSLSLVIFFRASAKVLFILLGIIFVLDSNGINVTTGLAALGIGGIALALGAQKAIENVVGSIIIIIDQPFRVGDFCKIGNILGTIENIGLRSTRIRTLADTILTYPNGMLSSETIENYTFRRKFLLQTTLNLRYETETTKLENILEELRLSLRNDKRCFSDAMRVRFIGYGATSLDVEIFVYIRANDYQQFLERQESVLLGVSHIVEKNGSGFAFPSQTVYLATDSFQK